MSKLTALLLFTAAVVAAAWPALDAGRVEALLRSARSTAVATVPTTTPTQVPADTAVPDIAQPPSAPPCSLDWSLPYSDDNLRYLADCRYQLSGGTGLGYCPPPGSPWSQHFWGPACTDGDFSTPVLPTVTPPPLAYP